VSAVSASPADSRTVVVDKVRLEKVRALQHTLYRTAKADPGRRFHALWDKVLRRDVLWRGWIAVRANEGAPGIDSVTLAEVEEYGVVRLLDELADELRQGRYRPLPARRVFIPKPGVEGESRPLSIPSVRDRIVQAAVKIVLEPVFEAEGVRVDLVRREVYRGQEEVHLTPTEYKLLTVLVRHAGKVLTHGQLLKDVWGSRSPEQSHYVRVYMAQLRQKLEADPARPRLLVTEPGVGYRLKGG